MKKDYFILEFFKSGPFILLLFMAILILLGIVLTNNHRSRVQMKEDVLYIAPKSVTR